MNVFKMKLNFQIFPRLYFYIIIEQLTNKVQVIVRKKGKMYRFTVIFELNSNINIQVKPNDLRQDHGWKS